MVTKILSIAMIFMLTFTPRIWAGEVMVCAAASLSDSLKKIGHEFEKNSSDTVKFNFGGSKTLSLQIEHGLPCDLFFAADQASVETLVQKKRLKSESISVLLKNRLVIIGQSRNEEKISSLFDFVFEKRDVLAIADPQTAPAGVYATEALTKAGLYPKYKPFLVPCLDVRAAMALVESGNAKYAIVYATDVRVAKGVKMIYQIPTSLYSEILYTIGVVNFSDHPQAALHFLNYLKSPASQTVFKSYGFESSAK